MNVKTERSNKTLFCRIPVGGCFSTHAGRILMRVDSCGYNAVDLMTGEIVTFNGDPRAEVYTENAEIVIRRNIGKETEGDKNAEN